MRSSKTPYRQIRASYTQETIVMYQAYNRAIAEAAIKAQSFVEPFSFGRMTWIKPSYLWLMERSGWGKKRGQQHILAVHITRAGFEEALRQSVLTSFEPKLHASPDDWEIAFKKAKVHVQWDPERSWRGEKLEHRSIQVGISRHLIRTFVSSWIVKIEDLTRKTQKIRELRQKGSHPEATRLLPKERPYPLCEQLAQRVGCEPAR